MHAAKLEHSKRLQSVLKALWYSEVPLTTWDLIHISGQCAISSAVSELRDPINNIPIECKCIRRGVFEYTLI